MGDKDVIRLDISVDNRSLVQIGNSAKDLEEYFTDLINFTYLTCDALVYLGLCSILLRHVP